MQFFVEGKPMGKPRHRTGRGRQYADPKGKAYEDHVKGAYMDTGWKLLLFRAGMPLSLSLTAFFVPPKSWSQKKTADAYSGLILPTAKPDLDNISKIILDALNKVAYPDDSQIVKMNLRKVYGKVAGVEVEINQLEAFNDCP